MTTTGERQADVARLRSALSELAVGRTATDLMHEAGPSAVVPARSGVPTRSRAGARAVNEPECRSTRASIRDYLTARLLPHRRRRFEAHLDRCAECTRAFIDVREVTWRRFDLDQRPVTADRERDRRHRTLRSRISTATG